MRTYFDCIPCFFRQALDSVRLVTDDEAVHEELLREVLRAVSEMDLRQSPPAMGQHIHRLIRRLTGRCSAIRGCEIASTVRPAHWKRRCAWRLPETSLIWA